MRPFSAAEVVQLWVLIAPVAAVGVSLAAEAVAAGNDATPLERQFDKICNDPLGAGALDFILRLNDWHAAANELGGNPFVGVILSRLRHRLLGPLPRSVDRRCRPRRRIHR